MDLLRSGLYLTILWYLMGLSRDASAINDGDFRLKMATYRVLVARI